MTIRSFNKTGERFANEGEYSIADITALPRTRFVPPTLYPTGGPAPIIITIDTCTPALPYASQENNNKVFYTPPDATQEHLHVRKPVDAGSIKILSNNISHLIYQQCRTLAVLNGPGAIAYAGSDRDIADTTNPGPPYYPVHNVEGGWTDNTPRNWYREIAWSQYSSRRLGPFFGITDRKVHYDDTVLTTVNVTNNATCIRKMILVVRGYKTFGGTVDDARFHIHVVVTSDGGNPLASDTQIIPLFGQRRAYITECTPAVIATSREEGPLPCPTNSEGRDLLFSGFPAYSVNLDWPSQATAAIEPPDLVKTYNVFTEQFTAFIPIDCLGDITNANASYMGTNVFQYYVHVGWLVGQAGMVISSMTLLEVRDPGSAEADSDFA